MMKSILGSRYKEMLKPEYKDYSFEKMFDEKIDAVRKEFYDKVIPATTDNDPTVQKTIKYYRPTIVYNKSKIHFLLHNTYATLVYFVSKQRSTIDERDMPSIMLFPISNNLCFCLLQNEKEIDMSSKEFVIPIETWDSDDKIKKYFIDVYITPVATSFVVDDTNLEILKERFSK